MGWGFDGRFCPRGREFDTTICQIPCIPPHPGVGHEIDKCIRLATNTVGGKILRRPTIIERYHKNYRYERQNHGISRVGWVARRKHLSHQ